MKPLPWVALGVVVLLVTASVHGYDLLANPLGWLLVAYGVAHVRFDASTHGRLTWLVTFAGLVAVVLWPAPVAQWLEDTDDSLAWAASLPQVLVAAVLCHELAGLARRADDTRAGRWFDLTRTLTLVAGVMPVLVLGGHIEALQGATDVVSIVAPLMLAVLLFRYAARPWAIPAEAVAPGSPEAVRPG